MKNHFMLGAVSSLLLAVSVAQSQPPDRPGGAPRPGRPGGPDIHRPGGAAGPHRPMPFQAMPLFAMLDTDGDGMLSSDEIAKAAEVLGRLDTNQDGNVTLREAQQGARKAAGSARGRTQGPGDPRPRSGRRDPAGPEGQRPNRARSDDRDAPRELRSRRAEFEGAPGPRMVERLMLLDADQDGKLSADELPERMARMMDQLDTNEDGFLDADELKALPDRLRQRQREDSRSDRPERRRAGDEVSDEGEA